jgi:hypothetical protein
MKYARDIPNSKEKKKIMKTKQIRKDKRNCPKVKSIEEQRLKIHHRPLAVFVEKMWLLGEMESFDS